MCSELQFIPGFPERIDSAQPSARFLHFSPLHTPFSPRKNTPPDHKKKKLGASAFWPLSSPRLVARSYPSTRAKKSTPNEPTNTSKTSQISVSNQQIRTHQR